MDSSNNNTLQDNKKDMKVKTKPQEDSNPNKKNEDPAIEYINSSRGITQEEVNAAPLLIIDEESPGNLFYKRQLKINAAGLIGGRNAKDGVAIFGQKKPNEEKFKSDFEIEYKEVLPYPYIFAVYYQRENKSFYIRAYSGKSSDNRILFVKLSGTNSLPLKQREILSAGNAIFQLSPIKEGNKIEVIHLSKKDTEGTRKTIFDPSTTKEITIGRESHCTFAFPKEKSFSRIQTTIKYEAAKGQWPTMDGSKTQSSPNGTWVFGTHSFEIKDQMIVEILTTKIKFTLLQNEK